jgi:hypothetical protein
VQTKGGASDIFMVLFAFGFILGLLAHLHPKAHASSVLCSGNFQNAARENQNYITKFLVALQNKLSGNLHDVYV